MLFLTVTEGADGPPLLATCDQTIIGLVGTLLARRLTGDPATAHLHPLKGRRSTPASPDGSDTPRPGPRARPPEGESP